MIRRREHLLLPASSAFITMTLIVAFVLNILPWGRYYMVPDFLALVFVFWSIHQPRRVGMGIAFVFGLLMDVHNANLLGQHALAYTLLSYGAISLHRRVPFFGLGQQILIVLPLFLVAQLTTAFIRYLAGVGVPEPSYFLQSLVTAMIWPLADALLLAPQRRAVERDDDRPL